MYNLPPFCCICFNNKEELKSINSKESIETQILNKLNFCSFETEWIVPDFPIFICRKCCHILDLACDFKNMCIKSNRLLRGYVSQLKSASSSVDNIRNELYMMFNSDQRLPDKTLALSHDPTKNLQNLHLPEHKIDSSAHSSKMLPAYGRPTPSSHLIKEETREEMLHNSLRQNMSVKIKQETAEDLVANFNNSRINKSMNMGKNLGANKTEKIVVQVDNSVMNCFDIKSEFVNELATCSANVNQLMHNDNFGFDLKPSGQHQCTLCNKCFSRESVLTRHMLIHSGERPHHCSICNKNFTHKFNLKQHMLIHSGHKSHHCSVCDKGFIKKSDLDRHMLTHFGERIHHCTLCSKSFVRKENLNQHILTHTGQKPHHCVQCNKSFLRKSDLNRHTLLCMSKRS